VARDRPQRVNHHKGIDMVVRTWSARATPEGADLYQQHFGTAVLSKLSEVPGFRGAIVLRADGRDAVTVTDLTFWDSLAAIEVFAGSNITTAIVDDTAQGFLLDYDKTTTHSTLVVDSRE
jgi:heme-degrading monooxygenase HmoA